MRFIIEYEVPPLRAIYHVAYEACCEAVARKKFEKGKPLGKIRKVRKA